MKCERCKRDNPDFSYWCGFCGGYVAQYPVDVIREHLDKATPDAVCVCRHCGVETKREWSHCNMCGLEWNVPPKTIKYYLFNLHLYAKLENGMFWFKRNQEKCVWIQEPCLWDMFYDAANDVQPIYGYDEETEDSVNPWLGNNSDPCFDP